MSPRLNFSPMFTCEHRRRVAFTVLTLALKTPAQFTERADSVRALRAISVNRREDIGYKIPYQRRKEL